MKYIIVSIFLVLSAVSISSANTRFEYYYNEQRPGGDYKHLRANNVDECAQACERDNRCRSFDFDTYERQCWLKDRIPGSIHNRDVISGVKRSGVERSDDNEWTTGEVAGLFLENNTQRKGGTYKRITVKNARACVKLCAAESTCRSFNYNETNRVCRLKNNIPSGIYNDNAVSGYKLESIRPDDTYNPSEYEVAGLLVEDNTKRSGGDYNKFNVRNARECARACANDRTCQSFNYGKEYGDCWLKNSIPDGVYNNSVVSGYKAYSQDSNDDNEWTTGEVAGLFLENNLQRKGGTYKKMSVKNARACVKLCAAEGTCQSFNYNEENRVCRLNKNIPKGIYNGSAVSGYKARSQRTSTLRRQAANEVAGVRLYDNIKRNGGDYNNFTVKNVKECAIACANDKKCRSFNYGKKHRDCWLKHSVPKGVQNTTVISGVKQR